MNQKILWPQVGKKTLFYKSCFSWVQAPTKVIIFFSAFPRFDRYSDTPEGPTSQSMASQSELKNLKYKSKQTLLQITEIFKEKRFQKQKSL